MTRGELEIILDLHKQWLRDDGVGVRADLSGANLLGANLWAANLSDANLEGASLVGANYWYANNLGDLQCRYYTVVQNNYKGETDNE